MATSVTNLNPLLPLPATATANAAPAADQPSDLFAALFRTAVAVLNGTPADAALAQTTGRATTLLNAALDEAEADAAAADAANGAAFAAALVVNVPQAAVDTAATATPAAAANAVVATATVQARQTVADPGLSRAQQLRRDFPGGPAQVVSLTGRPAAATLPTLPAPTTPVAAPVPTAVPTTTPTAVAANPIPDAATFAPFQTIPAQAPIVTGLTATPPILPGAGLVAPATVGPVTALTSTTATPPVTATQSGDRPTTAGDRFAAIAEAGARVAATAPPHTHPTFTAALDRQTAAGTPGAVTTQAAAAPASTAAPSITDTANVPVTIEAVPTGSPVKIAAPVPDAKVANAAENSAASQPSTPFNVTVARPASTATPAAVAEPKTSPVEIAAPPVAQTPVAPTATTAPAASRSTVNVAPPPLVTVAPQTETTATAAPIPIATVEDTIRPTERPKATTETTTGLAVPPEPARANLHAPNAVAATSHTAPTPAAQLADGIAVHAGRLDREGTVEFRLQLDPPDLGRVRVHLISSGDEIQGRIVVADDAVRKMVESQLPELRQRLEAAGLTVQHFDVATDPGAGGNRNPYHDAPPPEALAIPRTPPPAARPVIPRPTSASGLDIMA